MNPGEPKSLGLDPERLPRIDAHLAGYTARGQLSGTLLLIARRGAIGHVSVQGPADRERGKPLKRDALFRIYSMTKPIVSVALMMLFERGLFQLDDPVERFIPSFARLRVAIDDTRSEPVRRPVTIRHVLTHTSGLTYGFQRRTPIDAAYRAMNIDEPRVTLAEWVDQLATLPLEFQPGDAWNYSVSNDVVGRLVEVISGKTLDAFFRDHIFAPLGMIDTDFFVPEAKLDRFTACYQRKPDGLALVDDPTTSPFRGRPRFLSGGGGLISTVDDYLAFADMLLNGGVGRGVRLLSPKTVALMGTNHLPGGVDLPAVSRSLFGEAAYAGFGYGLGMSVMVDPAKSGLPGNAGDMAWGGVANTYFWVDPAASLIAILMTQALPSTGMTIRRELRTLVYSALTD